jgi:biopolymer transport protein ExbD
MNLRPHPPPPPELNLTPLVDVVFLLLLFFMISTTFEKERELPLTLPEAEGQPISDQPAEPLVIAIDHESRYVVAGTPLATETDQDINTALLEALTAVLGQAAQDTTGRPLLIEADAATPHQAVMRAVDAAQALGFRQLAFAAKRAGKSATADRANDAPDSAPSASPAAESPAVRQP